MPVNSKHAPVDPRPKHLIDPPPELKKLVELLTDPNLTYSDIDVQMGWKVGSVQEKLRRFPILRTTVAQARILAMRRAGLEKSSCYRVYVDALDAELEGEADHRTRIQAADRIMTLYGERVNQPSAQVNVVNQINMADHSILHKYMD